MKYYYPIGCIFTLAIVCYISFCIKRLCTLLFIPSTYSILVDGSLSEQGYQVIKNSIEPYKNSSLEQLYANIQQQFCSIKALTMQQNPNGTKEITIQIHNPRACINNTLLLFSNGTVSEKNLYQEQHQSLPHLIVTDKNEFLNQGISIVDVLKQLPTKTWNFYNSQWLNEHYIVLADKNQTYSIVCDGQTLDCKQLSEAENIIKQYQNTHKVTQHLCADIRFNKQIILTSQRGVNGKNY